jgi:hypothetical protein
MHEGVTVFVVLLGERSEGGEVYAVCADRDAAFRSVTDGGGPSREMFHDDRGAGRPWQVIAAGAGVEYWSISEWTVLA